MTTTVNPADKSCDSCGRFVFRASPVTVYVLTIGVQRVSLAAGVGIVDKSPGQPATADVVLCDRCAERDPSPLNLAGLIRAATRPSA